MPRFLLIAFALLLLIHPAEAKRVALVIGNDIYPNLPEFRQLEKAVNDARAMRDVLKDDLGFEVIFAENADFRAMNSRIKLLEGGVGPGDIVFMYYSGHGVSIGGENFLLPTDIPRPVSGEESRLIGSSFGAEDLIVRMKKRGARAVYAVFDACRDNPFETDGGRAVGGQGGLTTMDASEGVFILFSAGVRQTALDRLGPNDADPNSIFTRSLIPALKQGGLSQVDLAKRIYSEVKALAASVNHEQNPAYYDQIEGFVALKEGEVKPETQPEPVPEPEPQISAAAADWERVKNSKSVAVLEAFRLKHGGDAIAVAQADEAIAALAERVAILDPPQPQKAECGRDLLTNIRGKETCLKPGDSFTDCDGCPEMVTLPAGRFMMGSPEFEKDRQEDEGPRHEVRLANRFAAGRFEVTMKQFAVFLFESGHPLGKSCIIFDDGGWRVRPGRTFREPGYEQTDSHPAVCVSWEDAQAYAAWLSEKTGNTYRLLSEAEWEYAARGGTARRFAWAGAEQDLCRFANGSDQAAKSIRGNNDWIFADCDDKATFAARVGSYGENGFGLRDAAGNAAEWVQDCYRDTHTGAPVDGSPVKDIGGCDRTIRGGGWSDGPEQLRVADRAWHRPQTRHYALGFRLAREF